MNKPNEPNEFIQTVVMKYSQTVKLHNTAGFVSVKHINKVPSISTTSSLTWLTEDDIFHKWNTDIFMGQIEEINNIKVNFNGFNEYRAIAKIRIDKVIEGLGQ